VACDQLAAQPFEQEALFWIALDCHENVTKAGSHIPSIGGRSCFLEHISGGELRA
jgi:hypothetical protein